MGTWGAGSFENDAVLDWLAEVEGGGVNAVRNALDTAADADPDEYLEADDAQAALGAAEIVAAASGKGDDRIAEQEDLIAWLAAHRQAFGAADVALARRAVERVLTRSELQELWDDGGPDSEWRAVVAELLRRLSPAGGGAAPRPAATKKPAPAQKPAPRPAATRKPAPKPAATRKPAPKPAAAKKAAPKKPAPKR